MYYFKIKLAALFTNLLKIIPYRKKHLILLAMLSSGCTVDFVKSEQPESVESIAQRVQALMPQITGRDNVSDNYKKFRKVLSITRNRYVDNIDSKNIVVNINKKINELNEKKNFKNVIERGRLTNQELAIFAMLQTLDEHSSYMNIKEYGLFREDNSGKFGGIGIRVRYDEGYIRVVSVFRGTPAERAKLQKGDLIIYADGKHLKDYPPTETLTVLRGKVGEPVNVRVDRNGKILEKSIVRDNIIIPTQEHRLLEQSIGYIKLNAFNSKAKKSVLEALYELQNQNNGALSGLILDLRQNPGGLLSQAIDVSGIFIKNLPVVRMKTPNGQKIYKSNYMVDFDKPVVIIINGESASAAEIVSGALRDHGRAILVGDTSYGKSTVQNIIPLGDLSAIKLTVARYYLPNGETVEGGITPDVIVTDNPDTSLDEQLTQAIKLIKMEINN